MAQEVIDAFAHVFPRDVYEEMRESHPTAELEALADAPRFWDMGIRLELFDEYGIDGQVLTLARPPVWNGLAPEDALPLARTANDAVRRIADDHDEFIPVATLPHVTEPFREEFRRCMEMDMAGVQLFTNVEGRPVDSAAHRELYDLVTDYDVPVWLHPQLHEWHEWDSEYMLHKILGWPFDTSLACSRLVFSGIMSEYPDLTVIPHHMGAMVPHFISRIELFHEQLVQHRDVYPYEVQDVRGEVRELFGRFYGDTCRCGDAGVLEAGHEFFGADRFLFATDYPFGPDRGERFLREEVAAVERMDVDAAAEEKVFGGNLERLLS